VAGWHAAGPLVASGLRLYADALLRARLVYSLSGRTHRALAVRGAEIVAVSDEPDGLDDLVGPATVVVDGRDLTVLPAFADAHEHLMEAAKNTLLVPVDSVRSVVEFQDVVGAAARSAAPGEWVLTSMDWHESNLAENRVPTRQELDAASPDHPVFARRGGHLAIANSAALAAAGVSDGTPDPAGGAIGRAVDGQLTGVLEGAAVYQVQAFAPSATRSQLISGVRTASARYAAFGVGTIREAMITVDELGAYQAAREVDALRVRVRPLIRIGPEMSTPAASELINGLGVSSGFGDDWVRLWGLKFVMDGGVEGGATEQPYADDPSPSGHLN
jgi:predicted amidohydrolase YtcJ